MSRASADLLDLLHGLAAESLVDELVRARAARDEDGNPVPINPQLIDKALKFLKDNQITAPASNKPMNNLAETLGALDIDEAAQEFRPH
ncbi:hypothetical protein [Sphingomonas sp.]|uniref:hypothetical protein n=1 Tax=Sphingomonas sp. TaxID=28214 RepID=UPI003BEEE667